MFWILYLCLFFLLFLFFVFLCVWILFILPQKEETKSLRFVRNVFIKLYHIDNIPVIISVLQYWMMVSCKGIVYMSGLVHNYNVRLIWQRDYSGHPKLDTFRTSHLQKIMTCQEERCEMWENKHVQNNKRPNVKTRTSLAFDLCYISFFLKYAYAHLKYTSLFGLTWVLLDNLVWYCGIAKVMYLPTTNSHNLWNNLNSNQGTI